MKKTTSLKEGVKILINAKDLIGGITLDQIVNGVNVQIKIESL